MAFFENVLFMSRLLAVVSIWGNPFMCVRSVLNMAYMFVCGENVVNNVEPLEESGNLAVASVNQETSFAQFSACVHNLEYLYPSIFKSQSARFKHFNEFCMAK